MHWGKFSLALHDWDDPIIRVTAGSKRKNLPIITALVGEATDLERNEPVKEWWKGIQ